MPAQTACGPAFDQNGNVVSDRPPLESGVLLEDGPLNALPRDMRESLDETIDYLGDGVPL